MLKVARIWTYPVFFIAFIGPAFGAASQDCLKVFDATLYKSKPDLAQYGVWPIALVGANNWLPRPLSKTAIPEELAIHDWFAKRQLPKDLLAIDLEHWAIDGDPALVKNNVSAFLTLLDRVRRSGYSGKIGYYSLPPIRNYWQAIADPSSDRYKGWQRKNDVLQPLADAVDVFFPSLYTFYDDKDGWVRYAISNLAEARRMAKGKPVYAFIWPQFHSASKTIGSKDIPSDFWKLQLETIEKNADGVVIWGGYRTQWDDSAGWWKVTSEFIASQPASCRSPLPPNQLNAK